MGEAKWVKVEVNMYDDTKLKIIDNMDNRDSVHYFWTRVLVLAGKINRGGHLYITDDMPYTIKTLAIEFNRSVDEVKAAFKVLKRLEMIEFTEDKAFKIKNWDKHQNIEGLERLRNENNRRVAKHRAKKKETKGIYEVNNDLLEIKKSNEQIDNEQIYSEEIDNEENLAHEYKGNTSDFDEEVFEPNDIIADDISNIEQICDKDNLNIGNVTENKEHIIDNNINETCNITCNDNNSSCNITVMEQKKKENKKKIEKKKEIDIDIAENDINSNAIELMIYYEKITGVIGGLNHVALRLAIDMHGKNQVKMAIDKALEVNQTDMRYINGILKNWRREGYPKEAEVKKNGARSTRKNNSEDKNQFTGFKPKKPRNLTEAQRRGAEKNLI
jgi:predicted phage replisome organizer